MHSQRYATPSEKHAPGALMAASSAWGIDGPFDRSTVETVTIFAPRPNPARAARRLSQLLECRQVSVESYPSLLRHRDVLRLVQSARHAVPGRGRRHRRSRARLVQCIVSRKGTKAGQHIGWRAECRSKRTRVRLVLQPQDLQQTKRQSRLSLCRGHLREAHVETFSPPLRNVEWCRMFGGEVMGTGW